MLSYEKEVKSNEAKLSHQSLEVEYFITLKAGVKIKFYSDSTTVYCGSYLVFVLYQITEYVIWVQNPPITVFNVVSPNQEISSLLHRTQFM